MSGRGATRPRAEEQKTTARWFTARQMPSRCGPFPCKLYAMDRYGDLEMRTVCARV
ncbi:hypothetical protein LX36DRAFT_652315 [Colletotrichum falcatum]|nr:hypothetical protein LX36DRAFT_652315 [Colletotrichum falcatum]